MRTAYGGMSIQETEVVQQIATSIRQAAFLAWLHPPVNGMVKTSIITKDWLMMSFGFITA